VIGSAPARISDQDEALQRHATAHSAVSDCPLLAGAGVTLLPGGGETLTAVFEAVETARHQLLMEYYIFEDVHWGGRSLVELMVEKIGQGVQVVISYDGAGSQDTDDALFDRLRQAGATLLEFRPLNPLRRRYNPLKLNDRDHRELLVVDQRIAFLGGVNMSRVYENPRSAGPATDTAKAFCMTPPCTSRQGGETLAAEHRLGMLPGGVSQHEVIQPMVQPLTGDADAGVGHVGEIRQRLLSRYMVLTEDHLPIGTVFGAPGTHPALQAATQPIPVMIGMTALHLLEQPNRPQAGMGLEHRADLAVP
jgi:hypothetical protein